MPLMPRLRRLAGSRARHGVHVVGALVLTWPLALHLGDHLPLGTEDTATVPLFNLWTLRWEADRFAHGLSGFWTAPLFHPARGTLAYSEVQPLTAAVFAPLSWLTGSPVLAYNAVLLGALALNGWAGARLARRLGVEREPAILVGVLAQALPFVLNELGVLQLVVVFPLLVAVERVVAWAEDGGFVPAVGAGAAVAVAFLTSVYYGLFLVVALVPFTLALTRRRWFTPVRLAQAASAALVAAGVAGPFVAAQQHWISRFTWSTETVVANSAAFVDFFRLDDRTIGSRVTPWLWRDGGSGQRLFPGSVLLGLALIGAWLSARGEPARRRLLAATGLAIVVCGVVTLGLRLDVGGAHPYDLLRDHVSGFARLRSPFRMALMVQVLLFIPASLGVAKLWTAGRSMRLGVVAVTVVGVLEVAILPMHLVSAPPRSTDWSRWLARQHDSGAAAMVPFAPGLSAADYEPTVEAMLLALDHGHALVNGYSGFFPAAADELTAIMASFPDGNSLANLMADDVTWVVVDRTWLRGEHAQAMAAWVDRVVPRYRGREAIVYQLRE